MINPEFIEQFKIEANKPEYLKHKERVRKYIEERYTVSTKSPTSIYSIRVGFQMSIADIPQSALAYWLHEWGYTVEQLNGRNENHGVFLTLKTLDRDREEQHYRKEWKPRKKGTIVY